MQESNMHGGIGGIIISSTGGLTAKSYRQVSEDEEAAKAIVPPFLFPSKHRKPVL